MRYERKNENRGGLWWNGWGVGGNFKEVVLKKMTYEQKPEGGEDSSQAQEFSWQREQKMQAGLVWGVCV